MMLARTVLRMSDADALLMRRVQRWTPARWLRWWMLAATRAGDGWLWALAGIAVLLSGSPDSGRAFLAAFAAVTCGIALFSFLKRAVNRRRPCWFERQSWHNLLPPDQFSFPSGHSITAFAVVVPFGSFYPAAWFGLLFCAASVAASRVVLGMHYLSDVIAGCAIGALLGYIACRVLGLP